MKQFVLTLVMVCGVCAGVARDAHAQTGTWADRGYINIGFGVESGSSSLADTQNLVIYEEAWGNVESPPFEETGRTLRDDYPTLDKFRRELPGLLAVVRQVVVAERHALNRRDVC